MWPFVVAFAVQDHTIISQKANKKNNPSSFLFADISFRLNFAALF
jgi:hypothetical protein